MSVNKDRPHVMVLPEDYANRQLAHGFWLRISPFVSRQLQVLPEVGGWTEVLNHFKTNHLCKMEQHQNRYMVLLIDFDKMEDRLDKARIAIPQHLAERVFVLGAWSEPEDLKKSGLGSYESIGAVLAEDCRTDTYETWGHTLLRNNAEELTRMREHIRSILFQ